MTNKDDDDDDDDDEMLLMIDECCCYFILTIASCCQTLWCIYVVCFDSMKIVRKILSVYVHLSAARIEI